MPPISSFAPNQPASQLYFPYIFPICLLFSTSTISTLVQAYNLILQPLFLPKLLYYLPEWLVLRRNQSMALHYFQNKFQSLQYRYQSFWSIPFYFSFTSCNSPMPHYKNQNTELLTLSNKPWFSPAVPYTAVQLLVVFQDLIVSQKFPLTPPVWIRATSLYAPSTLYM